MPDNRDHDCSQANAGQPSQELLHLPLGFHRRPTMKVPEDLSLGKEATGEPPGTRTPTCKFEHQNGGVWCPWRPVTALRASAGIPPPGRNVSSGTSLRLRTTIEREPEIRPFATESLHPTPSFAGCGSRLKESVRRRPSSYQTHPWPCSGAFSISEISLASGGIGRRRTCWVFLPGIRHQRFIPDCWAPNSEQFEPSFLTRFATSLLNLLGRPDALTPNTPMNSQV